VDEEKYRTYHLMGMQLPGHSEGERLVDELQRRKIFVSLRGSNIRISINVFNTEEDINQLIDALG
jgi:selenocysteine lyase/cysteine desulfurase